MPRNDFIFAFLTDLKHQRQVTKRLFELAETNPVAVLDYLDTLPDGWETRDDPYTDLLLRLQKVAARTLRRRADS